MTLPHGTFYPPEAFAPPITFAPNMPDPAPRRHQLISAIGMGVTLLIVAAVLIGVTVNGGNSYSCPAGDASDLSLCERVAK